MKTLYSFFDEEGDQPKVDEVESSESGPSRPKEGTFGSGAFEERIVEDVVE